MSESIIVYNTSCPFGIESNGGIYYLKVILDNNHNFVKDRLEHIETTECNRIMKEMQVDKLPIISNMRKMNNGTEILRIRINIIRGRKIYKMNYGPNIDKEDYLTGIDKIRIDSIIDVKFKIGKGYTFIANQNLSFGLNIYLDEITLKE
jgi:hypothetical protein